MNRFALLCFVAVTLATPCCAPAAPRTVGANYTQATKDLLQRFIAAINSKNSSDRVAFIAAHVDQKVDPKVRLERFENLAKNFGPFKLLKVAPPEPNLLRALIEDKNGEPQTLIVHLTRDTPAKIESIMLGPGEDFNAETPKDYTGWQNLTSLAKSLIVDTQSPAISISLIRDGKLETAVAGVKEVGKPETVSADMPWSIGSIGKPICSTIIGKLIDEGKLKWETTLKEALPDIKMIPEYEEVTLEQIMHHRGGIPEALNFNPPMVKRIVGNAKTPTAIRANFVADTLTQPMISKPGAEFHYSNAGYAILGHIAERIEHKPYETLVKDIVFKALGLTHSYTGIDKLPADMPSGHIQGPNGLKPVLFSGPLEYMVAPAGGGMYMSTTDLAKFGQAHLLGLQGKDGFLKAATVQRLHQGLPEGPMGGDYACGWGNREIPGVGMVTGHNGSNGTFRAELSIFVKQKLVVVAIVNRGGESDPSPSLQAVLAIARKYSGH